MKIAKWPFRFEIAIYSQKASSDCIRGGKRDLVFDYNVNYKYCSAPARKHNTHRETKS